MAARAHLWKRLVALSAVAATLFPAVASADSVAGPTSAEQAPIGKFTGGAGAYLSFVFGETLGVGYGVEAFGTFLLNREGSCASGARSGIGPKLQFGAVNFGRPRLVVAMHGGGEPGQRGDAWVDGELGATFRFGERRGIGLHTGILVGSPFLAYGFGRAEFFLNEYSVGAGASVFTPFGFPGACSIGRALRTEHGVADLSGASIGSQLHEPFKCEDPQWVAAEWEHDAQMECASIPAFLQLAHELMMVNAPDHLIEEALTSAEQEIHHAQLCATLATRYSGRAVFPQLPDYAGRPQLPREHALARLATESWIDGCLGEGAAAKRAFAASRAGDPVVRETHAQIARDESAHAALGARVLTWALREGGCRVRDALVAVRDVAPEEIECDRDRSRPADAREHGRLGYETRKRILVKHVDQQRRNLDCLLLS